jgi:hypothetical protein
MTTDDKAELVERLAKLFKIYHRNFCYPDASDGEAEIFARAVLPIIEEREARARMEGYASGFDAGWAGLNSAVKVAREEGAKAMQEAERAAQFISPSDGDHAELTALFRAHRNSAEREIAELKGALMKAGPIHAGPIGGELGRKYPDARQCVIEFAPEQAAGAYNLHYALVRLRAALDPAQIAALPQETKP